MDNSSTDQLVNNLKKLRKEKGWSQEDVAREIGVSLSTIQRWERQSGKPSRLALRELTKLFKEVQHE